MRLLTRLLIVWLLLSPSGLVGAAIHPHLLSGGQITRIVAAGGASFGDAFQAGIRAGATSAVAAGVSYGVADSLGLNPVTDQNGVVQGIHGGPANLDPTAGTAFNPVQYGSLQGQVYNHLSTLDKLGTGTFWTLAGTRGLTQGALAVAQGGKFATGVVGGLAGTLTSTGANLVGDLAPAFSPGNVALHTALGCVGALAGRQDCAAGAIGGGVSALVSPIVGGALADEHGHLSTAGRTATALASVTAGMGAAAAAGKDYLAAGQAAQNEVMNNFLGHVDQARREALLAKKRAGEQLTAEENAQLVMLQTSDQMSDGLLQKYREGGLVALSSSEQGDLSAYLESYRAQNGTQATRDLILNGPQPTYDYPYAGTRQMQASYMEQLRAKESNPLLRLWAEPEVTDDHAAFNRARIDSGLFLNTHPNESFLPSRQALSGLLGDVDAIQNSVLAATGYLGATVLDADSQTRSNLTRTLSNLSDVGSAAVLPRTSLTPGGAFGISSVAAVDEIGKTAANSGGKIPSAVAESPITSGGTANAVASAGLKLDLKTTQAANEVVDSLRATGQLPSNYVTKTEAMQNGWQPGRAVNNTNPGRQIGGDVFDNSPQILPSSPGRVWYEADIGLSNTISRPKQPGTRLLYSNDGQLYITSDHYKSVTKIGTWK